jgi:hypothetical protein
MKALCRLLEICTNAFALPFVNRREQWLKEVSDRNE